MNVIILINIIYKKMNQTKILKKLNLLKNNVNKFKLNSSLNNRFEPWFHNEYQTPTSHNRRILHNNPTNAPKKENIGDVFIELKPGQEAPIGYVGKKEYPDWYKPYSYNVKGTGFLVSFFALGCVLCYLQYLIYLKKTGRDKLVNYRNEHQYYMDMFLNYKVRMEQTEMSEKNPMFRYINRYVKESGW